MNLRCDACPLRDRGVRKYQVTLPGGRVAVRALCTQDADNYRRAGSFLEVVA